MIIKVLRGLLCSLSIATCLPSVSTAAGAIETKNPSDGCQAKISKDYWIEGFAARVKQDLVASKNIDNGPEISGDFDHDGHIYNVRITKSSNDAQVDIECLQAILGAAQYRSPANLSYTRLQHFDHDFGKIEQSMPFSDALSSYRRQRSEDDVQDIELVLFKVPLDMLERCPGVFTKEELTSSENLFSIKNNSGSIQATVSSLIRDGSLDKIAQYNVSWLQFLEGAKPRSNEQVKQFAKEWYKHFEDFKR